jgi:sialic acid synthase SpsE
VNNKPVYFIADIAANHDGDIERAKRLISLAKESGANAVKFQHFKAETIINKASFSRLGKKAHQSEWGKPVFDVYKQAALPLGWTPDLKKHCDSIGIDFFTTPYDLDYVDYLDDFVSVYKIGSGDITWHELIKKVAKKNKPVILATGASRIDEVVDALDILFDNNLDIVLMQCNTNYTGDENNFNYINLNVLKTFSVMFPSVSLGLSDHTPGDVTTLGAVALGATFIEKHFTDDNNRTGPDHKFSMSPTSWKEMVERTRTLEKALGSSVKKVEENEEETFSLQRRAIRAAKDLKCGTKIDKEDIINTRPCEIHNGDMPPFLTSAVLGKKLTIDIKEGEPIKNKSLN